MKRWHLKSTYQALERRLSGLLWSISSMKDTTFMSVIVDHDHILGTYIYIYIYPFSLCYWKEIWVTCQNLVMYYVRYNWTWDIIYVLCVMNNLCIVCDEHLWLILYMCVCVCYFYDINVYIYVILCVYKCCHVGYRPVGIKSVCTILLTIDKSMAWMHLW
jgi:hypothetical protein